MKKIVVFILLFTVSCSILYARRPKPKSMHSPNIDSILVAKNDSLLQHIAEIDSMHALIHDLKALKVAPPYKPRKSTAQKKAFVRKTDSFLDVLFKDDDNKADEVIRKFDSLPAFGIFKDNYITVGTQMFTKPNKNNSDCKFQISFRQRLTKSKLPFKTYLFLTYTQKNFWDIFQESFPFHDINFNPTIGIGRAMVRNNKFLGTMLLQFEHESNGRDKDESRSWNKISLQALFRFSKQIQFQAKAWIPFVDGQNNRDIVRYMGYGFAALDYSSKNQRFHVGCVVTKRGGYNLNANVALNFAVRMFNKANQYFFLEYYNGYGESMLDYKQYRQRLRVGFIFRPDFIHFY